MRVGGGEDRSEGRRGEVEGNTREKLLYFNGKLVEGVEEFKSDDLEPSIFTYII